MLLKNLIVSFFIVGTLQAQFTKSIDISSFYDDNLFRSPDPVSDLITDLSLGLKYKAEKSNMSYFYNGSLLFYQDNALRNFSMHSLGFDNFVNFGKDDYHSFYFGANWALRKNGEDYNYYDYDQLFAYTNFRLDLDGLFIKAGYNFRYRSYTNIPDLTNYRHFIFLQANRSFESKTTIILETHFGYKSFTGQDYFSTTRIDTISNGRGKGKMSGSDLQTSTNTSILEIPSLSQVVLLARVTQSLHNKVGIYLQYRRQFSLTDRTNFLNSNNFYQDEELFDDPFSYESESVSSQLTWVLPWFMKVKIGGSLLSKNYISEQAYTSSQDTSAEGGIRLDERKYYYLKLSKTLHLKKDWVKSLHFNLDYSYIRNESNSYWYDYKNAVIGGGIQWNF
ncbi:MAG: hypothetical protein D8M58_07465 [Calditrichaeota bacterium]|nr:MAG: hypothetical protein DWQ03_19025 [Calditrichota bacterium]MBL1205219.1 hypothetical protein [Calditrichota bacterium]NOG45048.1 hypothetical protein [Calditrichota bacterium]